MSAPITVESAPLFVCARNGPSGNAAVAKNSATVNPIAATHPTTTSSRQSSPRGSLKPARRAASVKPTMPIG